MKAIFSIRTKITLSLGLLILIVSSLFGVVCYKATRQVITEVIFQKNKKVLKVIAEKLKSTILESHQDLLFLSSLPSLLQLIELPKDSLETTKHKKPISEIFLTLLQNKNQYLQIRFLDETGKEQIRLESINNKIKSIEEKFLQDKSSSDYFRETMRLSLKKLYISPLNLNREKGKIQLPYKSTLRFATPLFDTRGKRKGLIIINLNASHLLQQIYSPEAENIYLVNQEGFFLKNSKAPDKEFAFEFKKDLGFKNTHPSLIKHIEKENVFFEYNETDLIPKIQGFRKIFYHPRKKTEHWTIIVDIPATVAFQPIQKLRNNFILLGLATAVFIMSLGYFWAKEISSPIVFLTKSLEKLSDGDLKIDLPLTTSNDEISQMFNSFRRMIENFRTNILELQEGVRILTTSTDQILSDSQELTISVGETSVAINEVSSFIEEVKQTVSLSNEKAKNVTMASEKVIQVSEMGKASVEDSIANMKNIEKQMQAIAEAITLLNEKSQEIEDITFSVSSLAEQSNLLAVNASIEAAKAGEQGKGFTVVAKEIRNLAEQSKNATLSVKSILNEIKRNISSSVDITKSSFQVVESGVEQSLVASKAIQTLRETLQNSVEAASQIEISSEQELVGMEQIFVAILQIQEAGNRNLRGTQQTQEATQNLSTLGDKLEKIINQYHI